MPRQSKPSLNPESVDKDAVFRRQLRNLARRWEPLDPSPDLNLTDIERPKRDTQNTFVFADKIQELMDALTEGEEIDEQGRGEEARSRAFGEIMKRGIEELMDLIKEENEKVEKSEVKKSRKKKGKKKGKKSKESELAGK